MELTIVKSSNLDDWYIIERAEHDGRMWFEQTGPHSSALRCSSRFSDADVEGHASEMMAIALAIIERGEVSFRRCSVDARREPVRFRSPRNSNEDGEVTLAEADRLATKIIELLGPTAKMGC